MTNNTEVLLLEARFFTYTLFQRLFGNEPTAELLELLCSAETRDVLDIFNLEKGGAYERALRFLDELSVGFADDPEGCLEAARREYMKCFVGPGKLALPVWESVYLSKDHLLFQQETLEVRRFYRRHGVTLDTEGNEADDHIAFECGFMALMSRRAAEAIERGDILSARGSIEAQSSFLEDHLLVWVPLLDIKSKEIDGAVLYPQLVALFNAFLTVDATLLKDLASVE